MKKKVIVEWLRYEKEGNTCNSYIYKGKIYDSLPEEMLREAFYREVF